jgi:hypothetical protein
MNYLFEDDLVEGVVQGCAAGGRAGVPALQVRRFHAERERCYRVLDPEARAAAFAAVQLTWFREWGMEQLVHTVVDRFPALAALTALAFRKARGRNDEGAELYRDDQGRWRGLVALRPERFGDAPGLTRFLQHELGHLADMVDEHFDYSPHLDGTGPAGSQSRLVRERYRLLWDVSVDGRLTGRGLATVADEAQRRGEFERGFAFLPETRRAELFAALWSGKLARHDALMAVASDPRGLRGARVPLPGAACPLCGFPAFAWTDGGQLAPDVQGRIGADFPGWSAADPVCARCAEMYAAVAGQVYPATVCL